MSTHFDVRIWRNHILGRMAKGGITYRALAARSGLMHMTVWRALNSSTDVKASTLAKISMAVEKILGPDRPATRTKHKAETKWDSN